MSFTPLPLTLISYIAKSLNIVVVYNLKTKQGQYRAFILYTDLFCYFRSDWVKLIGHSKIREGMLSFSAA